MRRHQIIALCVVIILATGVLVAKARVQDHRLATATPMPPSPWREGHPMALPQTPPDRVPEAARSPAPTVQPSAPTAIIPSPGQQPVLLFLNGQYGECECQQREFRAADRTFASLPKDLLARFIVQRIDTDKATHLLRQHHVLFPPAVILLDAEGKEVYRHEYGVDRDALMEKMTGLLTPQPGTGR